MRLSTPHRYFSTCLPVCGIHCSRIARVIASRVFGIDRGRCLRGGEGRSGNPYWEPTVLNSQTLAGVKVQAKEREGLTYKFLCIEKRPERPSHLIRDWFHSKSKVSLNLGSKWTSRFRWEGFRVADCRGNYTRDPPESFSFNPTRYFPVVNNRVVLYSLQ